MNQGHLKEAFEKVEKMEEREGLKGLEKLEIMLLKSNILYNWEKYEESVRITESILVETKRLGKHHQEVDALILLAKNLLILGRDSESLQHIEQGEQILAARSQGQFSENTQRKAALLNCRGIYTRTQGNLGQSIKYHLQSLFLNEETGDKQEITFSLINISRTLAHYSPTPRDVMNESDYDQLLEYSQKNLTLAKESANKISISTYLDIIAGFYCWKGNWDRALEYWHQALEIYKEIGYKKLTSFCFFSFGLTCRNKGDIDQSQKYHQENLVLCKKMGWKISSAWCLYYIGDNHQAKGDIDQALEYLQQCLVIFKENDSKWGIMIAHHSMGLAYAQKYNFNKALKHLQQELKLSEEFGNRRVMSTALFELVSVTIEMNALEQAQQYHQHLQRIDNQQKDVLIHQMRLLGEAMILKTSRRARNRVRAEDLLHQVIQEKTRLQIGYQLDSRAIFHLCDLLLFELRISEEQEILTEVHTLLAQLNEIAKTQNSYSLLIQVFLLQAKLALMELELDKAKELLSQAQTLAEEKGLKNLAMKITKERVTLVNQLDKWINLREQEEKPSIENSNYNL